MRATFYFLAITILVLQYAFSFAQPPKAASKKFVIMGYFGNKNWTKAAVKTSKITHAIYAFANLTESGVLASASAKDSTNLAILNSAKSENKNLKILISIGGWEGCKYFSDVSLTTDSRAKFIKSAIDFMQKFQLDGIDIDWEYPGQAGAGNVYRQEDKQNFTLLLKEFRTVLNAQAVSNSHSGYLLTAAVGINDAYLKHVEVDSIQKYLDYINLMTYDIYSGGDKITGHLSNLYQSKNPHPIRVSTADAIENYIKKGVPADKLVMGLPFYGRGWTMVNNKNRGLYQPSSGYRFSLSHDSLSNVYIKKNGFNRFWDRKAKVPYLWNPVSHTFITYVDERSFKFKTKYVKEHQLAGVMFWEYSQDTKKQVLLNKLYYFINN